MIDFININNNQWLFILVFFFIPPQLDAVYHHSGVKVNNKTLLMELIIQRNDRKIKKEQQISTFVIMKTRSFSFKAFL